MTLSQVHSLGLGQGYSHLPRLPKIIFAGFGKIYKCAHVVAVALGLWYNLFAKGVVAAFLHLMYSIISFLNARKDVISDP